MAKQGSSFVLRLDGIKLPEEVEQNISTRLQAVFMEEVGKLDLKPKGGALTAAPGYSVFLPNKWWWGIWVDVLNKGKLVHFNEELSQKFGEQFQKSAVDL